MHTCFGDQKANFHCIIAHVLGADDRARIFYHIAYLQFNSLIDIKFVFKKRKMLPNINGSRSNFKTNYYMIPFRVYRHPPVESWNLDLDDFVHSWYSFAALAQDKSVWQFQWLIPMQSLLFKHAFIALSSVLYMLASSLAQYLLTFSLKSRKSRIKLISKC